MYLGNILQQWLKCEAGKDYLASLIHFLNQLSLWCLNLMLISRTNKKEAHEAMQLTYFIASTQS